MMTNNRDNEKVEWLMHQCTLDVIEAINLSMKVLKESWSLGEFTGKETSETLQLNSQAIGQYHALAGVLEFIKDTNKEDLITNDERSSTFH